MIDLHFFYWYLPAEFDPLISMFYFYLGELSTFFHGKETTLTLPIYVRGVNIF